MAEVEKIIKFRIKAYCGVLIKVSAVFLWYFENVEINPHQFLDK